VIAKEIEDLKNLPTKEVLVSLAISLRSKPIQ